MPKVAESAQELFGTQVPEAIARHPEKLKAIGAVYLFKVTGAEGGTWTVDFVADPPTCTTGDGGNAQCTVELPACDFKQMLADPTVAMKLFFKGRLKIRGNFMLATRLQKLIGLE
jgi:hypothetical protein